MPRGEAWREVSSMGGRPPKKSSASRGGDMSCGGLEGRTEESTRVTGGLAALVGVTGLPAALTAGDGLRRLSAGLRLGGRDVNLSSTASVDLLHGNPILQPNKPVWGPLSGSSWTILKPGPLELEGVTRGLECPRVELRPRDGESSNAGTERYFDCPTARRASSTVRSEPVRSWLFLYRDPY